MSGPGELESTLDRFHEWLARARADAASSASEPKAQLDSCRPFGLVDLVEEFTALRQELKLQTKSARGLQEQTESLLTPLRQAIEHFRSVAPREEQAAWSAGKPIAEGLATLDEALDRCRGEIEKARIVATEQVPRKLARGPGPDPREPALAAPLPLAEVPPADERCRRGARPEGSTRTGWTH